MLSDPFFESLNKLNFARNAIYRENHRWIEWINGSSDPNISNDVYLISIYLPFRDTLERLAVVAFEISKAEVERMSEKVLYDFILIKILESERLLENGESEIL